MSTDPYISRVFNARTTQNSISEDKDRGLEDPEERAQRPEGHTFNRCQGLSIHDH